MASCSEWQDVELLPDALQELLADLGASPWAPSSSHTHPHLTYFNVNLSDDQYGGFFQRHYEPSKLKRAARDEKRWLEVRLQVLAAIGQCNSLKMIGFKQSNGIGEEGRVKEVEALWEGIEQASRSNSSSLQELYLWGCQGVGSSEAACEALGGVLRHSRTLRLLNMRRIGMDASGLGYLRSALGGNPNSALRVLDLSVNKVGGGSSGPAAGGAVLVAALLNRTVCPSLQHLKMVHIWLDVEGAELIGQALARNTTLRSLHVGEDDPVAMVRLVRTGLGEPENSQAVIDLAAVSKRCNIVLHISGMTHENVAHVEMVVWSEPQTHVKGVRGDNQSGNPSTGSQHRPEAQVEMVVPVWSGLEPHASSVKKKLLQVDELKGLGVGDNQSGNSSRGSQDPLPVEPDPLPVALQELLGELGGSQWPSSSHTYTQSWRPRTHLPELSAIGYGSFFPDIYGYDEVPLRLAEAKRWREVRLQVLTAIANCTTLTSISISPDYSIGVEGRTEEVEALWGGLGSTSNHSALENLYLYNCSGLGSAAACAALGSFLRRSPNLRELRMRRIGMDSDGLRYLRSGLEANLHSTLRVLELTGNNVGGGGATGGAVQVAALLEHTVYPFLQCLEMEHIGLDVEGAQTIGEALARNTSLRSLTVGDKKGVGAMLRTGLALENDASDCGVIKGNRSIISLRIHTVMEGDISDVNIVLRTNDVLEELKMADCQFEVVTLGLEIDKARSLKTLTLAGSYSTHFTRIFFRSLQENGTLNRLDLKSVRDEDFDENTFAELMYSLDRNRTLQVINLDVRKWEKEGKYAMVRETLRRNAGLATYLPTFYGQHLKFVTPTMGRLFLCGPPRAGKTTLRRTMVHFQTYSQKKGLMPLLRKHVRLPWNMTKGIEVEPLIHHDETLQVSIWDLAGQAEYRILHDYLFPNIHQACLFLFVFSPFDYDSNKVMTNNDISTKFENEFKYWLRFISSNVEKRGGTKAKLLVVITHLDKLVKCEESIQNILQIKFNSLKTKFVDAIDLSSGMQMIDAGSMKYMENILTVVFGTLKVLCEKAIHVPQVCEKINSALMNWVLKHPSQPFMSQEEFVAFCVQELEELKMFERADQNNIASAISYYLHDSGNIIYFKKYNLRVVNPNWITHIFLGKLIKSHSPLFEPTKQGYVERERLEYVIASTFTNDPNYTGLNTQDLINIMVELELCYEASLEDEKMHGFYIPTTISQQAGANNCGRCLQWLTTVEKDAKYEFFGRRLQCEDQLRTFFTEGFFPRFQVVLRNRLFLKLDLGMQSHQYKFGHNLISMVCNDFDILIECSGGGVIDDYVDILVRSKQHSGFASSFMRHHVLEELRDFCASPKGCPGVALVEGIINPYCVSELTPCSMRHNQAYLQKDYTKFLLDEKQTLQCGEGYFIVRNILDLVHHWPPIGNENNGIRVSHRMEDFVDAEDLADIVRRNADFHEQQKDCIHKVAADLVSVTSEMTTSSKSASHTTSVSSTIGLQRCHSDLSVGTRNETTIYMHMIEKLNMILEKQDKLMSKLDYNHKEILKFIRSVEGEVTKSKEEILRTLESRMDDIIGYHSSSMPRRPYFSSDGVSIQDRLIASIHIGKAVRLHLMCEERGGNHVVQEQPGHLLIVEETNCKWIRKLSVNGAKLLHFLFKVGFHVAAGVGGAIHNFDQWQGAMLTTVPGLVGETLLNDGQSLNMVAADDDDAEVAGGLQEVLESLKLQGQMWHLFQLKQVRYVEGKETAWLCNSCRRKCNAASLVVPC